MYVEADRNGKARLVRFTREHEQTAAIRDCVAAAGCPDSLVESIDELLSGVEFDVEIGCEIVYSAMFLTPAIEAHMDALDLTAPEMADAIYEDEDPAAFGARLLQAHGE